MYDEVSARMLWLEWICDNEVARLFLISEMTRIVFVHCMKREVIRKIVH